MLLFLVLLECVLQALAKFALFVDELISGLIQLVDMVAEVFGCREFEQVGIECGHVRLNVIKEECLHEVATVDTDGNFFKKLCNGETLRLDALLHKGDLVLSGNSVRLASNSGLLVGEGLNSLLREAEAVKGIQTVVALAHVVDDKD